MGEAIPREWVINVLHKNEHNWTLASSDQEWEQMWEEQKLTVDHVTVVSVAMAEPMEEDEKEEEDKESDIEEGFSTEE